MNHLRQIYDKHVGIGPTGIQYLDQQRTIENERPDRFIVSLDIGKHQDYSFRSINDLHLADRVLRGRTTYGPMLEIQRKPIRMHRFVDLHRYQIGMSYPDLIRSIGDVLERLPGRPHPPQLVVDGTGVGQPVVDSLTEQGLRPFSVVITAGLDVTNSTGRSANVPKAILASTMDAALADGRVSFVSDTPGSEILKAELMAFRVKTRSTGSVSYEALKSSDHDDGVLSVMLSIWFGQNIQQPARLTYIQKTRD